MAQDMERVEQTLFALEMDFMRADFGRDIDRLAARISDDFCEFGQSGRTANKRDTVDALSRITEDRGLVLSNFRARALSQGVCLATYRAEEDNGRVSNRSSIWIEGDGQWKILFHQGTT